MRRLNWKQIMSWYYLTYRQWINRTITWSSPPPRIALMLLEKKIQHTILISPFVVSTTIIEICIYKILEPKPSYIRLINYDKGITYANVSFQLTIHLPSRLSLRYLSETWYIYMILSRDPSANSFPFGENRTTWIGSVPSWCSPYTSRVLASNTIHLPLVIPTTITSPSDEKQADWAWSWR